MHPVFKAFKVSREGMTGPAFSVFIALASHLNDKTGRCFPSLPTLARFTLYSRSTVQEAISLLVGIGRVRVAVGGGRKSNNYVLTFDEIVTPPQSARLGAGRLPTGRRAAANREPVGTLPKGRPDLSSLSLRSISSVETDTATAPTNQPVSVPVSVPVAQDDRENGRDKDNRPYREIPETPVVSPFEDNAASLVTTWKQYTKETKKPVFKQDFIRLLSDGAYFDAVGDDMIWIFTRSNFYARESPDWRGHFGFENDCIDIASSGAFATTYSAINRAHFNFNKTIRDAQEAKQAGQDKSPTPDSTVAPAACGRVIDGMFEDDEQL